jgi:hypothetical protein
MGLLKRCERYMQVYPELNKGNLFWNSIKIDWEEQGVSEDVYNVWC